MRWANVVFTWTGLSHTGSAKSTACPFVIGLFHLVQDVCTDLRSSHKWHESSERHSRAGRRCPSGYGDLRQRCQIWTPTPRLRENSLRGCDIAELSPQSGLFCVTPALAAQAQVFVAAFWLHCVSPAQSVLPSNPSHFAPNPMPANVAGTPADSLRVTSLPRLLRPCRRH